MFIKLNLHVGFTALKNIVFDLIVYRALLLKNFFWSYFFERYSYRKGETETFHLTSHMATMAIVGSRWTQETGISSGSNIWAIFHCSPRWISMQLDWKYWHLYGMQYCRQWSNPAFPMPTTWLLGFKVLSATFQLWFWVIYLTPCAMV